MTNIKCITIFALILFLNACSDSGVEVTATFSNTQDIREGALVYFEGRAIGEVSEVVNQGDGSTVLLLLKPGATKLVSAKSAIVVNRLENGAPLEIYNRAVVRSDNQLQPGQSIQGLDSMFQLGAWMIGDAIQYGSNSVSQYVEAFQEYLQGDEFQSDKAQVESQLVDTAKAAGDAVRSVEQDLAIAFEDLKVSEDEMAAAVEEFGDELAPVVGEIGRSGTELMQELERFAAGLERAGQQGEQESGQKFMESLLATLEKLNESFEQGALQQIEKQSSKPNEQQPDATE